MPKTYRIMRKDEEQGGPMTGSTAVTLGARVPRDITADADDNVQPNKGGMSVAMSCVSLLKRLPVHMIPVRLRRIVPGAVGKNSSYVWSMGTGPFQGGKVSDGLEFRVDPDDVDSVHGFIEPADTMKLNEYLSYLYATKDLWLVDEIETK